MRVWAAILACAGFLSSGLLAPASASEDPEALIREGVKLRREGQDARAEGYFKRAYELAKTSRTAAQLGLAELAVGEFAEAELHLSEALAAKDAWVNEHLKALEGGRKTARQHLLRVELLSVPSGSGATYALGGGSPVGVPADGVLWLAPATATLRVAAPGRRPFEVRVDGREGEIRRIAVELPEQKESVKAVSIPVPPVAPAAPVREPAPAATVALAPQPDTDEGRGLRIGGYALASVGIAAEIAGVILYMEGSSRLNEYRTAVNSNGQIAWNPRDESWKTLRQGGVACFVAGGAAIAGGVALLIAGSVSERPGEGKVSLVTGPGLGGVSLRGAF